MEYIINPKDNSKHNIFSNIGKNILKKYINYFNKQRGGMDIASQMSKKKRKKQNLDCSLVENTVKMAELATFKPEFAEPNPVRNLTEDERIQYMVENDDLCLKLKSLHSYRPYMYSCAVVNPKNNFPMMIMDRENLSEQFRIIVNPLTIEHNEKFGNVHSVSIPNPENHSNVWGVDIPILCAGWVMLNEDKKIWYIDNQSGHFKPSDKNLKCVVKLLKQNYPNCLDIDNLIVNYDYRKKAEDILTEREYPEK